MDTDVAVRRGSIAAIPLLLAFVLWLGFRQSDDPAADSAGAPSARAAAPSSASVALGEQARLGEGALGKPHEPTPAPQPASRLPFADDALGGHVARREGRAPVPSGESNGGGPCGGVTVRVITASPDPSWAFVSIAPSPEEQASIKFIGDRVGGWRVSAIEWDRVWLQSSGAKCAVGMHLGAREAAESVGALKPRKKPALEAVDAPPWYLPGEIAEAIEQRKTNELFIDAQAVDAIFEKGAELFSGLRLEPLRAGEQVVGLRLEDIKADSLLERLGIESGDVLLALNDTPLASLDSALQALQSARERGTLIARLERQGDVFDLSVRVRQ